jgi:hypothetical protein
MCAGIARRYNIESSALYVVTQQYAEGNNLVRFVQSSSYMKLFDNIRCTSTHSDVVAMLKGREYDSLFIYDDRVSYYHLYAPAKRRWMSVYEEGTGTYRSDYRTRLSGLRWLRWMVTSGITGCGLQYGDGRKTDYVIVQYPELYARLNPKYAHRVLQASTLRDELSHLREEWSAVIEASHIQWPHSANRVAFILGFWGGAPREVLAAALEEYDEVYYKAHPRDGIIPPLEGVKVITASWAPAEIYIDYLAQRCMALTVLHFSSSVFLNCAVGYDNVQFIDLLGDHRFVEVIDMVAQIEGDTVVVPDVVSGKS